ncbi:UNVERIFIED_CONTAM: putative JmjC domain-containing histone demethylation protein 2C [Gekko kuhli]
MAVVVESRPELVGKRFLCVCGDEPPEKGRWRAGVIRTVSHRDSHSPELSAPKRRGGYGGKQQEGGGNLSVSPRPDL